MSQSEATLIAVPLHGDKDGSITISVNHRLETPSASSSTSEGGSLAPNRAIILLHGFLSSLHSFDDVIVPLSQRTGLPVLAYDRVGFGDTVRPSSNGTQQLPREQSPYSNESAVELLDSLVGLVLPSVTEVVLVGSSAGGAVALEFALTKKGGRIRCVGVAVLGTPLAGGGPPSWVRVFAGSWIGRGLLGFAMGRMTASLPFKAAYRDFDGFVKSRPHIVDAAYRRPAKNNGFSDGIVSITANQMLLDLLSPDALKGLKDTPIGLVYGSSDGLVKVSSAVESFKAIAKSRSVEQHQVDSIAAALTERSDSASFVKCADIIKTHRLGFILVEGMGHLPCEEDPEVALSIMTSFITNFI